MPAWLLALIPLIMPLLKSLLDKEKKALKAGHDGPLTVLLNGYEKTGELNEATMKAAAESYVRCCS